MNKVADKILKEAELDAVKIREACDNESQILLNNHKEEMRLAEASYEEKINSLFTSRLNHLKAKIDLSLKKEILRRKHELLHAVLDEAKKRILNDNDLYIKIMKVLLNKGILTGREEIITHIDDRDLFIERLVSSIKDFPGGSNIKISEETIDHQRGFYLRDGKMEYNATMDIIFKEIFEDCEIDLVKILFE